MTTEPFTAIKFNEYTLNMNKIGIYNTVSIQRAKKNWEIYRSMHNAFSSFNRKLSRGTKL